MKFLVISFWMFFLCSCATPDMIKQQKLKTYGPALEKETLERAAKEFPADQVYISTNECDELPPGTLLKFTSTEYERGVIGSPSGYQGDPESYKKAEGIALVNFEGNGKRVTHKYRALYQLDPSNSTVSFSEIKIVPLNNPVQKGDPLRKWRGNKKLMEAVSSRKIYIGMPVEALLISWGHPKKVNRTASKISRLDQYVYGNQFVYISKGKVQSFQSF